VARKGLWRLRNPLMASARSDLRSCRRQPGPAQDSL